MALETSWKDWWGATQPNPIGLICSLPLMRVGFTYHLDATLTKADEGLISSLAPIVPTIGANKHIEGLFRLLADEEEGESSRAATPSPSRDTGPTPMLSNETHNYFASREPIPPIDFNPIDLLIRSIDSATLIQNASTAKFISWRPQRSLESSITSSASRVTSETDLSSNLPKVCAEDDECRLERFGGESVPANEGHVGG